MNFGGGVASQGGIQTAQVTLTPAQIRTIGAVVQLVPGIPGKTIVPVSLEARLSGATVAWDATAVFLIVEDSGSNIPWGRFDVAAFSTLTPDAVCFGRSQQFNTTSGTPVGAGIDPDAWSLVVSPANLIEGLALQVRSGGGGLAGANGSITIKVAYYVT